MSELSNAERLQILVKINEILEPLSEEERACAVGWVLKTYSVAGHQRTNKRLEIIALAKRLDRPVTARDLAAEFRIEVSTGYSYLSKMAAEGLLINCKNRTGYRLPEDDAESVEDVSGQNTELDRSRKPAAKT